MRREQNPGLLFDHCRAWYPADPTGLAQTAVTEPSRKRELIDRTAAEHLQAVKRARIRDVGHLVYARSDDLVARSPTMPPWSIYPLSPAYQDTPIPRVEVAVVGSGNEHRALYVTIE